MTKEEQQVKLLVEYTKFFYKLTRLDRSLSGNPRYAISMYSLITEEEVLNHKLDLYDLAVKRANKIGGKKYNTKEHELSLVFEAHNTDTEIYEPIAKLLLPFVYTDECDHINTRFLDCSGCDCENTSANGLGHCLDCGQCKGGIYCQEQVCCECGTSL